MKKIARRLVSLILAVSAAMALALPASATGTLTPGLANFQRVNTYEAGQYTDVPADHTFSENAKAGYEFDIMKGYGATFGVGNNITRLASIIIACRLDCIYYNGVNNIEERYTGTTQEIYLAYAKEHAIFCDFEDVSLSATRAEFAAILSSALPEAALTPINTVVDNAIPDVTVDMPYANEIYRLYRAGIINGSDAKGTFYPTSNITRGAACAIATRMCDEALRKSVELSKDYPTVLFEETVSAVEEEYRLAAAAFSSCTANIQKAAAGGTAGKSYSLAAASDYEKTAAILADAAALCGDDEELSEVKTLSLEAAALLKEALPAGGDVNTLAYWKAMLAGLEKAIIPMQKAAALLDGLAA